MLGEIDDITLFELGLFVEIGRRQSLRSIARGKSLRASHVSKALSRLERKLQKQLVLRSASGIMLTPEGERLLHVVRPLIEQADRLRDGGVPQESTAPQLLTIGAIRFVCERLIAPSLGEMQRREPGVRVRVLDFPPDAVVTAGHRGVFDIAVTLDPTPWTKAWDVTPLGSLRWRLHARAGHPLGRRATSEAVRRYPFVVPNYWCGDSFERGDDYCPIPLTDRIAGHETSSLLTALEIVESTDQLVYAAELACRRSVRAGRLVSVNVPGWKVVRKPIYLAVKADVVTKRLQTLIIDVFGKLLAE